MTKILVLENPEEKLRRERERLLAERSVYKERLSDLLNTVGEIDEMVEHYDESIAYLENMKRGKPEEQEDVERADSSGAGYVEMSIFKDGIHTEILTAKVAGEFLDEVYALREDLLKSLLNAGYDWIARDEDETLCAYETEPTKGHYYWMTHGTKVLEIKNDNFPQIQWEDSEPTKIADLLETYENGGESGN